MTTPSGATPRPVLAASELDSDPPIAVAYEAALARSAVYRAIVAVLAALPRGEQLDLLARVYVEIDAAPGAGAKGPRKGRDPATIETLILQVLDGRTSTMPSPDLVAAVRRVDASKRPNSIVGTASAMARPEGPLVRSGRWGAYAFALKQPPPAGEAP